MPKVGRQAGRRRETAEETRWNANLLPRRPPRPWWVLKPGALDPPVAPPALPPTWTARNFRCSTYLPTYTGLHVRSVRCRAEAPAPKLALVRWDRRNAVGSSRSSLTSSLGPIYMLRSFLVGLGSAADQVAPPRCPQRTLCQWPVVGTRASRRRRRVRVRSVEPWPGCLCTSRACSQRKRYKYLAQFGVASHLTSTISLTSHPRHYLVLPCLLSPTACPLSLLLCPYHPGSP